jgi:hypothetical protein
MSPFFFVQNSIAFLKFDMLRDNDLVPITDRIKKILKTCNFGYSVCGFYTSDCDGYFVLHLRNKSKIKTITELMENPNLITSVVKVLMFENVIELYDVCTSCNYRNKGYMSSLMNELIKTFYNKDVWLGVDFHHKDFDKIIDFYIAFGFGNPEGTMKTTQETMLNKTVLGLSYPTNQSKDQIKFKIKTIKHITEMNMNNDYNIRMFTQE